MKKKRVYNEVRFVHIFVTNQIFIACNREILERNVYISIIPDRVDAILKIEERD